MKLLLDTHALLWMAHEPEKLSSAFVDLFESGGNEIWVSAVSAMEIATKQRNGKLEYRSLLATDFMNQITGQGFKPLAISCEHAEKAGNYASLNKDPWDRLLAAQSELGKLTLVTSDRFFAEVGVATFW